MTPQEIANVFSQPIEINKLTLKNRIVMSPMAVTSPAKDGRPSDQTVAFFEARARGGVGMIIVGGTAATRRVSAESGRPGALRADIDAFIPDFRRVADAVHAHGVPIIAEITPSLGRMASAKTGSPIIAASPKNVVMRSTATIHVPGGEFSTPTPREATIAEIEEIERDTIATAERLHRAGWDGVEIPAIMSYFLASFLSPRTNWRTDQYGGSVENRARILVNIVKGIRQRVGPDFVVGLRIIANDYTPDGQGPEGFAAIAKEVAKAGIDYVALVYGCYESMYRMPAADGAGLIDTGDALIFKRALSVPVIVGSLHDPARGAAALAGGHGDLVMLARPMLADPDYARKVLEGRIQDIGRCDRGDLCMRRMMFNMPVRCSVNPATGRESRKPGQLPPLDRMLKAPVEQVVLRVASSKLFMDLAGLAMKKPKPREAVDG